MHKTAALKVTAVFMILSANLIAPIWFEKENSGSTKVKAVWRRNPFHHNLTVRLILTHTYIYVLYIAAGVKQTAIANIPLRVHKSLLNIVLQIVILYNLSKLNYCRITNMINKM